MLKVGDKAPLFALPDQNGDVVKLSDFLHKKSVVVFFYPKDGTPGCTAQSCSFRDRSDEFTGLNTQIIGVSQDDAESHQQFTKKHSLSYPLLSDAKGEGAALFGVSKTFGILAGRVTFVIDPDGVIQRVYSSQLNIQKHIEEALTAAKAIYSRTTSAQTPA